MAGKVGRPPVKTSYKPGQSGNAGNIKEHRLSTQLEILLKKANEGAGYEEKLNNAQALAEKVFAVAMSTEDPKTMLEYFKEIADRTEGKPKQSTDVTSSDGSLAPVLVKFVGEENREND